MELLKKNTSHKDGNTGKYFPLQRQFRDALVENQCQVGRNLKLGKNSQNKKTPRTDQSQDNQNQVKEWTKHIELEKKKSNHEDLC